jgi:hypothetical protein
MELDSSSLTISAVNHAQRLTVQSYSAESLSSSSFESPVLSSSLTMQTVVQRNQTAKAVPVGEGEPL